MRVLTLILLAGFAISCGQAVTPQVAPQNAAKAAPDKQAAQPVEAVEQPTGPIAMPQVQVVAEGIVSRSSDTKTQDGEELPPWKDVTIENILALTERPSSARR